ncbi:MAG: hypothetical protein HY586_00955, partial [Candidatus Omnitrophica bacterium]|nr:hypothetical protein [Candidatus Omnitrophota bacterium]
MNEVSQIKSAASFLLVFFTFQTLASGAPLDFPQAEVAAAPSFLPFHVSPYAGRIEKVFSAKKSGKTPFVFLIQDAHDSLDAQENVRKLLRELVEENGVDLVCFEGGMKALRKDFYHFTDDASVNLKILDRLFAQGLISGVERYAIEAPERVRFQGVEEKKSYFENLRLARKIFSEEEETTQVLETLDPIFAQLAGRLVTNPIKKIRDDKKRFEAGHLSLSRYAKTLARSAMRKQWIAS